MIAIDDSNIESDYVPPEPILSLASQGLNPQRKNLGLDPGNPVKEVLELLTFSLFLPGAEEGVEESLSNVLTPCQEGEEDSEETSWVE